MKRRLPLLIVTFLAITMVLYSKAHKPAPIIAYDKQHVEPLKDFRNYKDVSFYKLAELKEPPVTLYDLVGWENEAGDLRKVKIQYAPNKNLVLYNSETWVSIDDDIKLPAQSHKVQKYPYFITLKLDEEKYIIVLCGYNWASTPALLTLILVDPSHSAEVIFNKHVDLLEITEKAHGYRLLGEWTISEMVGSGSSSDYIKYASDKCELLIEHGALTFKKLPPPHAARYAKYKDKTSKPIPITYDKQHVDPIINTRRYSTSFDKVAKLQDPPVTLYRYVGLEKEVRDFSKATIYFASNTSLRLHNSEGWSKISDAIKLPAQPKKIQKHPYLINLPIDEERYILLLCGGKSKVNQPPLLTLVSVDPSNSAEVIFNKNVELREITETAHGYRLLGELSYNQYDGDGDGNPMTYPGRKCELLIEHGQLIFKEL